MSRGLCAVVGSFGLGCGNAAALIRCRAARRDELRAWLLETALPALTSRQGLGGAHLLEGAAQAAMTNEQRLRGADAGVDCAILVTGYDSRAVESVGRADLAAAVLVERGAQDAAFTAYRIDYSLLAAEVDA